MTPAVRGGNSDNYYTALDGYEEDTEAGGSFEGLSEAPSIRSPLKPRQRKAGDGQTKAKASSRLAGNGVADSRERDRGKTKVGLSGHTGGTKEDTGHTSTRRGRTPKRKEQEYIVCVRPKVEALLGNTARAPRDRGSTMHRVQPSSP